jgi:hypothetical protein
VLNEMQLSTMPTLRFPATVDTSKGVNLFEFLLAFSNEDVTRRRSMNEKVVIENSSSRRATLAGGPAPGATESNDMAAVNTPTQQAPTAV